MNFGDKIKDLRNKFGLKQIDLANSLGVSPQAVSKWERDENLPDIFLLKKIAVLFNVTTDHLLGVSEVDRGTFEATVFCSSINRFASRSVSLKSEQLAAWTNVIFHHLTSIVVKNGGVPVKYTGDGFLCFFSGPDHANRALRAAEQIKKTVNEEGLVIFLHTGEIYLGMIGHPDYASRDITGDTVNRAFLLMNWFSKHTSRGVALTESVHKLLSDKHSFKTHKNVQIPGLKDKDDIYVLIK